MAFHTFGPGLALDPLTMRGVPAMTVYLEDADTGDPVQAYTMDEDAAETTVRTNLFGYFPQFQVDAAVRRLRIVVGEVELIHGAWELIYKAEANTEDAVAAAQAAQAAAEHAASLVEAPADIKVAELIRNEGTATQRVLHGLYGARGNTFVQPTPPPAGTTYEWAGARNNSPSIKKIDGVEVATNLIPDPKLISSSSFTSTANTAAGKVPRGELFPELGDRIGDEVFAFEAIDGNSISVYTALSQANSPTFQEGKWYAGHVWAKTIPELVAPYRFNLHFRNSAHTTFSSDLVETFPSGTSKVRVVGKMKNDAVTWWVFWPSDLRRFPGEKIYVGAVILSGPADTEQEAIQAAKDYFDGDMPDDRANDVWFNTTDNREYIWDTDTKEWIPRSAPGLDDAGIAALVGDTNSDTRGALDTVFGATAQNTITAAALQAPGPVRDAFKQALRYYGATRAEGSPGARLVFGTIRNYGSAGGYWQPIDDNGHVPVGIASVETTSDRITITTTPVDNGTIVGGSLIAVTDETLAKQGYFVGGSGGGRTTHLMLGRSFSITDRIWWDGSNWAFERGNFTLDSWAYGHLRLDHPFKLHGHGGVNINWNATTSAAMVHPVITAETNKQTVVNFYDTSGTRLTTPTSACRFYLTRHESMDAGQVDPRDVEYPSGNIWFMLVQTYR